MDNENEQSEAQKNEEEAEATTSEETTSENELTPEQIAELKQKADVSSQNYERAKKAEARAKELEDKLKAKAPSQDQLSQKDVLALAKADIHEDDMDEVIEFAKFKKLPVSEALKNSTLKTILNEKTEERKTAAATQMRGGARGAQKTSSEDLLNQALAGKVPDDDAGIEALAEARMKQKTGGK